MQAQPLNIPAVILLTPPNHGDRRGFLSEVYNRKALAAVGVERESHR